MAVSADSSFTVQQYRMDIAKALKVDGYFYGRIQTTGDASGGTHRARFLEPDDSLVPTRCLWVIDYRVESSYTNGSVELIGKLGGNNQDDQMAVPLARQSIGGEAIMYPTNGGDLAGMLRHRGWIVPSFGPGTQRMLLTAYFDNTNLADVDVRIFGYYMILGM